MDNVKQLEEYRRQNKKNTDNLLEDLAPILDINDEKEGALILQASLHFLKEEYLKAAETFSEVLETLPRNESASRGVFHSYWKLGEEMNALEEIKRYWIEFGPNHDSELATDYRRIMAEVRQRYQR